LISDRVAPPVNPTACTATRHGIISETLFSYVKLHRSLAIGTARSLWLGLRSLSYDPHKLLPSTGSGQARRQVRKEGGFL